MIKAASSAYRALTASACAGACGGAGARPRGGSDWRRRLFSQGSRACRVGSQRINDAGRGNGARDVGEEARGEAARQEEKMVVDAAIGSRAGSPCDAGSSWAKLVNAAFLESWRKKKGGSAGRLLRVRSTWAVLVGVWKYCTNNAGPGPARVSQGRYTHTHTHTRPDQINHKAGRSDSGQPIV